MRHGRQSRVYFIQEGEDGPIKIGVSQNVPARLKDLQTSHASSLRLLHTIPGTYADEQRLHSSFDHLRIQNEWFLPAPELLSWISQAGGAVVGTVSAGGAHAWPTARHVPLHWSIHVLGSVLVASIVSWVGLTVGEQLLAVWPTWFQAFAMLISFLRLIGDKHAGKAVLTVAILNCLIVVGGHALMDIVPDLAPYYDLIRGTAFAAVAVLALWLPSSRL